MSHLKSVSVTFASVALVFSLFDFPVPALASIDGRPASVVASGNNTRTPLLGKPRFISAIHPYRPVKHSVRGYNEPCATTEAPSKSVPNVMAPRNSTSPQCASIYVCFNSVCRCGLGQAHRIRNEPALGRVHQCAKFSSFTCENDNQCQDIDPKVVCHNNTRQCRCKLGYSLDAETGYCKKIEKHRMRSYPMNVFKSSSRNAVSSVPVPTQSHQFFDNNVICSQNAHCTGEYTYCHKKRCKCWPEFQFMSGNSALAFNTSSDNQTSEHLLREQSNSFASENDTALETGYCVRKLCQLDSQCQTEENTNLICNKTICECRYGYVMYKDSKVCVKYQLRRQSCDLTCRIIGGLFASIFLLTLVYWCFYCCYSIVKNYRNHRLQARCRDGSYMYDFEPIDYERYLSANTLARNSRSNTSRFPTLTTLLRIPAFHDDPPTYVQATMVDEALPDYDAVMELQELRKAEANKPE